MIPWAILENDLDIHVFLESVESALAVESAPASRFKDLAQYSAIILVSTIYTFLHSICLFLYFIDLAMNLIELAMCSIDLLMYLIDLSMHSLILSLFSIDLSMYLNIPKGM